MLVIPILPGAANAHQRFAVQLGDNLISFELDFISYLAEPAWSMNLIRDGSRIVSGAMLESGSDIIQSYRTGIGQMVFTGNDVTLDNLGIENFLVWVPPLVEI